MRVYAPWLLLAACSTTHGQRSGADDARAPSAESADAAPTVEAGSGSTPSPGDADAPAVDAHDATAANDAEGPASADAGARTCDARKVTCRRAQPVCGELEAPVVEAGCWGPCVPIAECACTVADDCPDRDRFTCHLYAAHCGPYVH